MTDEAQQRLEDTADAWRTDVDDLAAEGTDDSAGDDSADQVAQGAERAAQQPNYGREGQ
jgi:hypothetical protein